MDVLLGSSGVCTLYSGHPLVPGKLYIKWHIIWKALECAWAQEVGYKTQRAQLLPHHTLPRHTEAAAPSGTVMGKMMTTKPSKRSMQLLLCCGVLSAALGCSGVTTLAVTEHSRFG